MCYVILKSISFQLDLISFFDSNIQIRGKFCELTSPAVGSHSVSRFNAGRFCWVCLGTGEFLRPQGTIPSGLTPFGGYCLVPEAPLITRMPTGPNVFLAMLDSCGLCPPTGPTLKRHCAIFVQWWNG